MTINIQELIEQKAALERQIAEAQRAQRAEAINQIRELMATHGLTAADLAGRVSAAPKASADGSTKKVAAKYRDPASGNTWTGRGLKPKWLQEALQQGKTLSDFAI